MKIVRLVVDKQGVLTLDRTHRQFFFLAGHMFNEIVVLRRLLLSSQKEESSGILRDARSTWSLVLLRLLAGKLWETRSVIKTHYHRPGIGDSPWLQGNDSISKPLGEIKRYFSQTNVINKIRNDFGFHYSLPDADLSNYGPDDHIEFLMGESRSNTIYYASEVVVTSDLFELLPDLTPKDSFDRIVKEIAYQSGLMLDLLNAYIGATCEFLAEKRGGTGEIAEELSIPDPKSLEDAKLEIVIKDELPA
jgi:hypothetical protein